jgi:hypothetical protein
MKRIVYLAVIVCIVSCKSKEPKLEQGVEPVKSRFIELLDKYKTISFDTLAVFSTSETNDTAFKFGGEKLDTADLALLPKELGAEYGGDFAFYACYQFVIDNNRIGLITRTPSDFSSTSLKLLVYYKKEDILATGVELADVWASAGDVVDKNAWLFKDKDQQYHSLIQVTESHDNSVNDPKDTVMHSKEHYFSVDLSTPAMDTINDNAKELAAKAELLLKNWPLH